MAHGILSAQAVILLQNLEVLKAEHALSTTKFLEQITTPRDEWLST